MALECIDDAFNMSLLVFSQGGLQRLIGFRINQFEGFRSICAQLFCCWIATYETVAPRARRSRPIVSAFAAVCFRADPSRVLPTDLRSPPDFPDHTWPFFLDITFCRSHSALRWLQRVSRPVPRSVMRKSHLQRSVRRRRHCGTPSSRWRAVRLALATSSVAPRPIARSIVAA